MINKHKLSFLKSEKCTLTIMKYYHINIHAIMIKIKRDKILNFGNNVEQQNVIYLF